MHTAVTQLYETVSSSKRQLAELFLSSSSGHFRIKMMLRLSLALLLALAQLPPAQPQADGTDCEDARYCDVLLGRYDCDTDVGAFVSMIPEGTLKQEVCPSTCEVPACAADPPPPPPVDPTTVDPTNVDPTTVDPTTGAAPPWVPLQGVPPHSLHFESQTRMV